MSDRTGISNRESAEDERQERGEHPPLNTDAPPPEDAAGRVGEQPFDGTRGRQTSRKAGSRSIAQKQARSRYLDGPMPASNKVAGAFGKEPRDGPIDQGPIDPAEIGRRAYEIYLSRGGADGGALDDWLMAERELRRATPRTTK